MMFKNTFVFVALTVGMLGCASTTHRGVIAMKLNDTKAHVGIGSPEVVVGDRVELYRNRCNKAGDGRDSGSTQCTKQGTGYGTVSKVFSSDYSEVSFERGVDFQEGDTVEKHLH